MNLSLNGMVNLFSYSSYHIKITLFYPYSIPINNGNLIDNYLLIQLDIFI